MKARIAIAVAFLLVGILAINVTNQVGRPAVQLESNKTVVAQMDGTDQSALVNHVNQDGTWSIDLINSIIGLVTAASIIGIMYRPVKNAIQKGIEA